MARGQVGVTWAGGLDVDRGMGREQVGGTWTGGWDVD